MISFFTATFYKQCIAPVPLDFEFEQQVNKYMPHAVYNSLPSGDLEEREKGEGGLEACWHQRVAPKNVYVKLALANLMKRTARVSSEFQEPMSLQLDTRFGDEVLECQAVMDHGGTKIIAGQRGDGKLVQAYLVVPAVRWVPSKNVFNWLQVGDLVESHEAKIPGVWLVIGWVCVSQYQSFFHHVWKSNQKGPCMLCVMVRLLSASAYIEGMEAGSYISSDVNLDEFDIATNVYESIDTTPWLHDCKELFPGFTHMRMQPFAVACYRALCKMSSVGKWGLRKPEPIMLKPVDFKAYTYAPTPGTFKLTAPHGSVAGSSPVKKRIVGTSSAGASESVSTEVVTPQRPPKKRRHGKGKWVPGGSDSDIGAAEEKKGDELEDESSQKVTAPAAKRQRRSVKDNTMIQSTDTSAMLSLLKELKHIVTDENLADKRHALCHTHMMSAMYEELEKGNKEQSNALQNMKDELMKCIAQHSKEIIDAAAENAATPEALVDSISGIVGGAFDQAQDGIRRNFQSALKATGTAMVNDARAQAASITDLVGSSRNDIQTSLLSLRDNLEQDMQGLCAEVTSLREAVELLVARQHSGTVAHSSPSSHLPRPMASSVPSPAIRAPPITAEDMFRGLFGDNEGEVSLQQTKKSHNQKGKN